MFSQQNSGNFEDSQRDLRVGIWIPKSFNSFEDIVDLIKQNEVLSDGDSELFTNNDDNLISEDVYELLCKLRNVCLLTTNFNYYTHLDLSFSKRSSDLDSQDDKNIDISPIRFFSPISSPKPELYNVIDDKVNSMGVASVLIVLSKEDLNKNVEFIKIYISEIIESFKSFNQSAKFLLVLNGIRDLVFANPVTDTDQINGSQDNSIFLKISLVNELSSYLLVYHDVDTIETDDFKELANIIVLASKSIRSSYSKRTFSKFKHKPDQFTKEEDKILKKTWMSQLTQIPNVGINEAKAISEKYKKTSEIIESLLNSRGLLDDLKSTVVDSKKQKTLGKSVCKRLVSLYSYNLLPDQLI